MLDINKLVAAENMAPCEADAYLNDLETWSEEHARQVAREEGLELTEAHLDVICYLRERHAECGPEAHARLMLKAMDESFVQEGGRKYLYKLFPHGPVTQACRMAGLPVPPGNKEPSFGSVH